MANRYTYDDFQKAMQSSGLAGQFSDADLKLAQQNPDAGMSILKYKQDYASATTDEVRALANMGAEGIRSSYGGYTGGGNGGQYYLTGLSPKDYQRTSGQLISVAGYGEISYDDAETLEKAGLIKLRGMDKRGNPIYIPVPKDPTKPILMTR